MRHKLITAILWEMALEWMNSLKVRDLSNSFLYFQGLPEYMNMTEME